MKKELMWAYLNEGVIIVHMPVSARGITNTLGEAS